ncbi:hypothetical protein PORCRE_1981 [Porphyromonas crevioricanis JCM 15906]|uniref:Uncharacterized protein n=2 Tax=Porphyromonas crevioricanis TaxID=393921 RepID=A0AB34PFN6_9PORP|nr:hypothetical protein HQ38_04450 [Porphyromonas crevioricanis]GAD06257.1 hypothetical protein PORCRE_1981 [Porphyromonas crevioricanis JCM 15906]GAD06769.1 hypothetical protein PORCAN_377 [Porphyromonas crevioricanis JCM 13913]
MEQEKETVQKYSETISPLRDETANTASIGKEERFKFVVQVYLQIVRKESKNISIFCIFA